MSAMIEMRELACWGRGLAVVSRLAPARLTTAQLLVFVLAAILDWGERPATMTEIRETLGPLLRGSVKTTYAVFLSPTTAAGDRLGWLEQHTNPLDGRERLLRLTPAGRQVVERVLWAVRDGGRDRGVIGPIGD